MSKTAPKPIPDASGHCPKVGDTVTAHYLAGDKPRVLQASAKVAAIRDDGTLDLAMSLQNRPVTLEGFGPVGSARFSVGWSRPQPTAKPAAQETDKPPSGDVKPPAGEKTGDDTKPPSGDAKPPAANSANPGPLKPVGG